MRRNNEIQKKHVLINGFRNVLFFILFIFFSIENSYAAGWVDVNGGVNVSPSTVTVGQNFTVSFSLKEYRGESKTFEYVQLWIQDGNGNDVYDAQTWNNVSFSANQQRNFSATTFLDPARGRGPGSYRAIVRGKVAGDSPFNFGIVSGSGAVNPRGFIAVNPAGRVDVNDGVTVSPSTVTVGQDFTVSFSLKEFQGGDKTFEYVQLWIQDENGNDVYDAQTWNNVSFSANQQKNFSATTFLDPARGRGPGIYRAIVRGKVAGEDPFNFGVVSGSDAVNPREFTAINPEGFVDISAGVTVSPSTVTVGANFTVLFEMSEINGGNKTFEYIEVWIQDGNGNDLYDAARWTDISLSPNQGRGFSTTTSLDPARGRGPGTYRAIVRGKVAGEDPFNFGVVYGSDAVNPREFTAINPQNQGWVSVSEGVTIFTPVILGQDFAINFSLKETRGYSKTFEKIAVAILWEDNSHLFDFAIEDNVTIPANGTRNFNYVNYIYGSNPEGTYKAVIRGLFNGEWFDFDTTGNGVNSKSFQVARSQGYTSISSGLTMPSTITLGRNFDISFTLKETRGQSKSFETICVAILNENNQHIFDFATYNNITIGSNNTWSKIARNSIYESHQVGIYKAVLRGRVGGEWFNFDTIENGVNSKSFVATRNTRPENETPRSYLFVSDQPIDKGLETIVLTHGWQSSLDDNEEPIPDELWTSFNPIKGAAGLIRNQVGSNYNIIQYVWKDAYTRSLDIFDSLLGNITDNNKNYNKSAESVPTAASRLAKYIVETLTSSYDKPIHFIGHSLGVPVSTLAAKMFLDRAFKVTKVQLTALDMPQHNGSFDPTGGYWKSWDTTIDYDRNYIMSVLNFPVDRNLNIVVDNYYSKDIGAVGDKINGVVYNHEKLNNPNDVGGLLFEEEEMFNVLNNNHSGVHQWYRWTIAPDSIKSGEKFCEDDGTFNRPNFMSNSLNPCQKGWSWSIFANPEDFPEKKCDRLEKNNTEDVEIAENTFASFEGTCEIISYDFHKDAIECRESSSPYAVAEIGLPTDAVSISFDYKFENLGDGDYASIYVGDFSLATLKGDNSFENEFVNTGPISLPKTRDNKLTVALFGVNSSNSIFEVRNFKVQKEIGFPWTMFLPAMLVDRFPYRADVDNDGNVDITDAMLVQRFVAGEDMSSTNWVDRPHTGDANCSGIVDNHDADLILRYSLGLEMSSTDWCVR